MRFFYITTIDTVQPQR